LLQPQLWALLPWPLPWLLPVCTVDDIFIPFSTLAFPAINTAKYSHFCCLKLTCLVFASLPMSSWSMLGPVENWLYIHMFVFFYLNYLCDVISLIHCHTSHNPDKSLITIIVYLFKGGSMQQLKILFELLQQFLFLPQDGPHFFIQLLTLW
jgi:hypothetical protein